MLILLIRPYKNVKFMTLYECKNKLLIYIHSVHSSPSHGAGGGFFVSSHRAKISDQLLSDLVLTKCNSLPK